MPHVEPLAIAELIAAQEILARGCECCSSADARIAVSDVVFLQRLERHIAEGGHGPSVQG